MLGLIKMDLAAAGKAHLRNETPSFFLNVGENDVFLRKGGHFGFQIVAQNNKVGARRSYRMGGTRLRPAAKRRSASHDQRRQI